MNWYISWLKFYIILCSWLHGTGSRFLWTWWEPCQTIWSSLHKVVKGWVLCRCIFLMCHEMILISVTGKTLKHIIFLLGYGFARRLIGILCSQPNSWLLPGHEFHCWTCTYFHGCTRCFLVNTYAYKMVKKHCFHNLGTKNISYHFFPSRHTLTIQKTKWIQFKK